MPIVLDPNTVGPAPITDATSLDGLIRAVTDIIWDGVLIKVDYTGLPQADYAIPFQANIYRLNADGTEELVRSGNPAKSYDQIVYAYDHEAAIGRAAAYRAVPKMADGSDGPSTDRVGVYVTMPQGSYTDPGVWAKCLDDPAKSMRLRMVEWNGESLPGNLAQNKVLNSPFKALTPDVRGGREGQFVVLTDGRDEYDMFEDLINAGPVLLQNRPDVLTRRDMYVSFDNVSYRRVARLVTEPEAYWTCDYIEQDRPSTFGQFLRIPGKSYIERLQNYPFFGDTLIDGHQYGDNTLAV